MAASLTNSHLGNLVDCNHSIARKHRFKVLDDEIGLILVRLAYLNPAFLGRKVKIDSMTGGGRGEAVVIHTLEGSAVHPSGRFLLPRLSMRALVSEYPRKDQEEAKQAHLLL